MDHDDVDPHALRYRYDHWCYSRSLHAHFGRETLISRRCQDYETAPHKGTIKGEVLLQTVQKLRMVKQMRQRLPSRGRETKAEGVVLTA
jgi:hypothetical protein